MNFIKSLRNSRAQAIVEYVGIFTGIVAAIAAISFVDKVQQTFRDYADRQIEFITTGTRSDSSSTASNSDTPTGKYWDEAKVLLDEREELLEDEEARGVREESWEELHEDPNDPNEKPPKLPI